MAIPPDQSDRQGAAAPRPRVRGRRFGISTLLAVIVAIFLVDLLANALLLLLVPLRLPLWAQSLADGLVLVLVLFPILYLVVFRPMVTQVNLRERTARALRESEARFRTLVAHAPVGIFLADLHGELTFVNERWSELSGLSLAEAEDGGWIARIHAEDRERVVDDWRRAVDARRAFYAEFRFRWPDGHTVWVIGRSVPLQDETGEVTGFIGSLTDVTERAQATEALRRSEAQLARAQKLAHLGSYEIDGQRRTLFWSKELYRITGRDPALREPTIEEYLEIVHPDDRERVRQNIDQILDTGQPFDYEYRIMRPDGEVRYLHSVGVASRDAAGKVVKIYGSLHDITERKEAEERMQQATRMAELERRRWQTTVESMPDLVMIADDNGRTIYVNPAFHRLIGYPARPDLPLREYPAFYQAYLPSGELFPWDELPLQRAALRNEALRDVEVIHVSPGGGRHITLWNASPLHDPTGRLFGAVAIGRDITAQRELQEQQEMLLHSVSHDLRIPLTIVNGHAQVLESLREEANVNGAMRQSIEAILLGAHRMNMMIADLVDAARHESAQLQLRTAPVDLGVFLRALLRHSKAVLEVDRITLDLPADLPAVRADANRLERIFLNLLSNAQKYSPPGTPVTVAARRTDGEVEIAVHNEGKGIAPEDLPHLFERFYRGKGEHKTEGLGLGLFITRMLVEAHGGRIHAESAPDAGSTFIFTLPVGQGD